MVSKKVYMITKIFHIFTFTFGMHPSLKEEIANLYESDPQSIRNAYNYYRTNEPAENVLHQVPELKDIKNLPIIKEVIDLESDISLDGCRKFVSPAHIKYMVGDPQKPILEFFMIVTLPSHSSPHFMLHRIYKWGDEENTFALQSVVHADLLQQLYGTQKRKDAMFLIYDEVDKRGWANRKCALAKSFTRSPIFNNPNLTDGIGTCILNQFTLKLNENKTILLPGVLICEYTVKTVIASGDYTRISNHYFFYVLGDSDQEWIEIYKGYCWGQEVWGLEPHLLGLPNISF